LLMTAGEIDTATAAVDLGDDTKITAHSKIVKKLEFFIALQSVKTFSNILCF